MKSKSSPPSSRAMLIFAFAALAPVLAAPVLSSATDTNLLSVLPTQVSWLLALSPCASTQHASNNSNKSTAAQNSIHTTCCAHVLRSARSAAAACTSSSRDPTPPPSPAQVCAWAGSPPRC